jgi:ribose 5-phosphate isomerase A
MDSEKLKRQAAYAAFELVKHHPIIGVGTGSTIKYFIDALASIKDKLTATVSSSEQSTKQLQALGIPVLSLNEVTELPVYVDGADEINPQLEMIKGGGAALTREKIIAAAAEQFICIADASKFVDTLGAFAVPIEVIAMAETYVCREIIALGGTPKTRQGVTTDNGHLIVDVHGWHIHAPKPLESQLNQIPGVVTCGLFAHRHANQLLLATEGGVQTFHEISTEVL